MSAPYYLYESVFVCYFSNIFKWLIKYIPLTLDRCNNYDNI